MQKPYHFLLAYAAAIGFWFPSRNLIVIGVTGTKGKTTAVTLMHDVLSASGMPVASASSLQFRIGAMTMKNMTKMTMPGRFFIQRFLRRGVAAGCRYAVLEVTSQGIAQFRHRGIRFASAVMTNVAPEHIEAHGGYEPYLRAKLDLFWRLPREAAAVINGDDPAYARFSTATAAHTIFYGKEVIIIGAKRWKISDVVIGADGIAFSVAGQTFHSSLVGAFNFYNILAAITVGLSQGIALERIAAVIKKVAGVEGRMEFVAREPVRVVVDYAHTPDSLKAVYAFLKGEPHKRKKKNARLICVLGAAGGGRDTGKRTAFGRIAEEYCDEVILTNEDPYDENPIMILADIEKGIPTTYNLPATTFRTILDRREAIREALRGATPGDNVVITGKGSEPWMMLAGGTKVPWDDRAMVREILQEMTSKG